MGLDLWVLLIVAIVVMMKGGRRKKKKGLMIFAMDQRSEGWSSTANVRGQDHVSTDDCS